MSQGEPVHVTEEFHDFGADRAAAMLGAFGAFVRAAIQRASERQNEPPAFSEKNMNQGGVTVRHVAPLSSTSFPRDSHAQTVILTADLPSGLGQRVRLRRAEMDLTQAALAEKAHVGRRTIQRLETDGVMPRPRTAYLIADALDKPVAWLEGGAEGAEHGNDRSEGDGR